MPLETVPTRLVILAVRSDQLLYQRARHLLECTPADSQLTALKTLVTSEITVWHGRAGVVDMSADLAAGLAHWSLSSVAWSDVLASIK